MTVNRPSGRRRRTLYRNPQKGKVAGVCAGVAEYFGFELWVVRIITVSLMFLGLLVPIIFIYCLLYFVLDVNPAAEHAKRKGHFRHDRPESSEDDYENRPYRPSVKEVWRKGQSPEQVLEEVESKFAKIETRLQGIETYVTSRRFELEKEFSQMER